MTNAYFAAELYKSTIYLKLEFPFVPIKTGERMQVLFLIRLTKVGIYSYISFSMGFFLNNSITSVVGLKIEWFSFLDGSYDWSPSTLAVLTAIVLVTLLPTAINKGMQKTIHIFGSGSCQDVDFQPPVLLIWNLRLRYSYYFQKNE